MLIGIFGTFGSGKTILLTILGFPKKKHVVFLYVLLHRIGILDDDEFLEVLKKGVKIYANYHIENKDVKYITPEDFLEINKYDHSVKALVLLQEAYTWVESRLSMSRANRFISYVSLQSRHRDMDIVYDAQLAGSVDLRLRKLTDVAVFCEAIKVCNKKTGKIEKCFIYRVDWRKSVNRILKFKFALTWSKAKEWFDRYDTYEVSEPVSDIFVKPQKKKKV